MLSLSNAGGMSLIPGQGTRIPTCRGARPESKTKKALLHSTGGYIQYPMVKHSGKEYENIHIGN